MAYQALPSVQEYLLIAQTAPHVTRYLRKGRRWQGDWATNFNWIRQDDLFRDLPTKNSVDFAFADLVPEHVILGFPSRDFATDVFAGLFVAWIHHTVTLIGKRRLGDGLLLVSTFRLLNQITTDSQHPVATIMLHDMIQHLAHAHEEHMTTGSVVLPSYKY